MNASRKTAIIAEGVALYAKVQDLTGADFGSKSAAIRNDWAVWCDANPQWIEFVEREQFNLFDRVNAQL